MLRLRRILSAAPRNLLKTEDNVLPIIPLRNPYQRTSARFIDIDELATKTAIERSRERLKDEISRGYFQDMKDLEKHGGKLFKANKIIVPAISAVKFPTVEVKNTDGSSLKLPLTSKENDTSVSTLDITKVSSLTTPPTSKSNDTNASASDTAKASLLCLSFRASSAPMVNSWSSPFLKTFAHSSDVRLYEVCFIDSLFLRVVRKLVLRFMRKPTPGEKQDVLKRQIVYSFGDHYYFRKELQIINLLTGYIFLLDKHGRIRWQGCGMAEEDELLSLISCTSLLLNKN